MVSQPQLVRCMSAHTFRAFRLESARSLYVCVLIWVKPRLPPPFFVFVQSSLYGGHADARLSSKRAPDDSIVAGAACLARAFLGIMRFKLPRMGLRMNAGS